MRVIPLLLPLINALALVAMRSALPVVRSRRFTVAFGALTALALAPWVSLALMGWRGMDVYGAATAFVWSASIAWQVATLAVVLSWPLWGVAAYVARRKVPPLVDASRRQMLSRVGLLVPLGGLTLGAGGVAAAAWRPFVRKLELYWEDLPEGLHGFKLGQFSDVHVGTFISPEHVHAGIAALNEEKVDLVVMTGDLHDDNAFMPAINDAFRKVEARHGLVGILGNHEYYAGVREYLRHVTAGPMKLLVDAGLAIEHDGARLFIGGVDYPFQGMDGPAAAASRSMQDAMAGAQPGDFKLCLAHHPTCWDEARRHGAHLTLSGHTHGGQVAFGGRSLFKNAFRYMLGLYEDGASRLFVTAGLGHWFPFRLGCPAEVVVIELRRGTAPA